MLLFLVTIGSPPLCNSSTRKFIFSSRNSTVYACFFFLFGRLPVGLPKGEAAPRLPSSRAAAGSLSSP